MWVLLRVLTALAVGVFRVLRRQTGVEETRTTNGIRWVYRQAKNKKRVTSTTFGVPIAHSVFLRLSRESTVDRYFKALGLAREIQTGEKSFDDRIYITSDHPAIEALLQADAEARRGILDLFGANVETIYMDGVHLWAQRDGDTLPTAADLVSLEKIRIGLASIPEESFRLLRDSFFWRALVVESIAWSLACYGIPAVIETSLRPAPLYFAWGPVIGTGLVAAVGIFALLGFLAWILLRGSSRMHRVFVGSIVLLAIGVPFSGVEIVSDANIALDRSAARTISVPVTGKYTTTSRGRRGRRRTRYHLALAPSQQESFAIPSKLSVSHAVYSNTSEQGAIAISVRQGRFNFPWIEEIRPMR